MGLPLLAPWANRLSGRRYRAEGVTVDLDGVSLPVDDNGLPIHGFLVGRPGWTVDRLTTRGDTARLRASIEVDAPAFPFPHRIEVSVVAREPALRVDTTIVPTGRAVGADVVRLASVPSTAGCAAQRVAAAPPVATSSRSSTIEGIPSGESGPSRPSTTRSDGAPSTTATSSVVTVGSRSRATTGTAVELRCGAELPVRSGVGAARQAVRRARADDRAHERLGRRHRPVVRAGDTFTPRSR